MVNLESRYHIRDELTAMHTSTEKTFHTFGLMQFTYFKAKTSVKTPAPHLIYVNGWDGGVWMTLFTTDLAYKTCKCDCLQLHCAYNLVGA